MANLSFGGDLGYFLSRKILSRTCLDTLYLLICLSIVAYSLHLQLNNAIHQKRERQKKMTTDILSSCLLLLILNKGFFEGLATEAKSAEALRICSKTQRYEVMRSMVHCAPRDTVVPVFTPPNLSSIQPRHMIVKKCQGSCWALPHSCISTQTRNLSLSITGQFKC